MAFNYKLEYGYLTNDEDIFNLTTISIYEDFPYGQTINYESLEEYCYLLRTVENDNIINWHVYPGEVKHEHELFKAYVIEILKRRNYEVFREVLGEKSIPKVEYPEMLHFILKNNKILKDYQVKEIKEHLLDKRHDFPLYETCLDDLLKSRKLSDTDKKDVWDYIIYRKSNETNFFENQGYYTKKLHKVMNLRQDK